MVTLKLVTKLSEKLRLCATCIGPFMPSYCQGGVSSPQIQSRFYFYWPVVQMLEHEKINYVEMPFSDLDRTKSFFSAVFGRELQAWDTDYLAFADVGLDGGVYRSDKTMQTNKGSALIIFYSADLESTLDKVESARAQVNRPTYYFPGGRRFHFLDPNGNEFAVWTDHEQDETLVKS